MTQVSFLKAPIPKKPLCDNEKQIVSSGRTVSLNEKPMPDLHLCQKLPIPLEHCEEMFSDNPKETPPLFYRPDALREPVEMAQYSEYNTSMNDKKKQACQEGDEYAYHPFYMSAPFEKQTPDIVYATRPDVEDTAPAPKCPTKGDLAGPITLAKNV